MKKYFDSTICWPLATILFILCLISCYTIKCAAGYITYPNPTGYWTKQLLYYGIGVGLIYLISRFGNDRIYSGMWIFYGILIVFLVGLVIQRFAIYKLGMHIIPFAKDLNGATSWYNFPGFSFQPSEFMKVVMIICMSKTISLHNERYLIHTFESDLQLIWKVAKIALPPMILTYLQNDAGVTLIMAFAVVVILFASGINRKWYIVGFAVVAVILIIFTYLFIFRQDIFSSIITGHKLDRFYGWVDPEGTYQSQGYQLYNAMMAYGTADLFGHGFETVIISLQEAHTDFIFSVITLGFGFVGAAITLVSVLALDVIILYVGLKATHQSDKYFIAGIFGCMIFQQFWNIAMILGLLPITGITLPFLSYGGSSLLSYMIAMGMCFDIHRQTSIAKYNQIR